MNRCIFLLAALLSISFSCYGQSYTDYELTLLRRSVQGSGARIDGRGSLVLMKAGHSTQIDLNNEEGFLSAQRLGLFPELTQLFISFIDSKDGVLVSINEKKIGKIKNGEISGNAIVNTKDLTKIIFRIRDEIVHHKDMNIQSSTDLRCCFIKEAICEKK